MALADFFSLVFCDWVTPSCLSIFEFVFPLYSYILYRSVCVYIYMHIHAYAHVYLYLYMYVCIYI